MYIYLQNFFAEKEYVIFGDIRSYISIYIKNYIIYIVLYHHYITLSSLHHITSFTSEVTSLLNKYTDGVHA